MYGSNAESVIHRTGDTRSSFTPFWGGEIDLARPKNVTLQEQVVAEAQKKLARIEKMHEEMKKQVEIEMQRLNEMREQQEQLAQNMNAGTIPSLGNASPMSFQSQFDQFSETKSNERLKPIGNNSVIDFTGKIPMPENDQPFYRTSDRDEHWSTLNTNPGKTVYVSGYYYSSGPSTKRYEYILGSTQLPISVGDMVQAPVHSSGHGKGEFLQGHDRRFIVTDIYTKEKFHPYHDVVW